jgi:hypothetical protein
MHHYTRYSVEICKEQKHKSVCSIMLGLQKGIIACGQLKSSLFLKACHAVPATLLRSSPTAGTGPSLSEKLSTCSRGFSTGTRALVNAATLKKTDTDLTAELKDVLSRVKPKVVPQNMLKLIQIFLSAIGIQQQQTQPRVPIFWTHAANTTAFSISKSPECEYYSHSSPKIYLHLSRATQHIAGKHVHRRILSCKMGSVTEPRPPQQSALVVAPH